MQRSPGPLADVPTDVEARGHDSHGVERDLSDADQDRRVGRCERHEDRPRREVEALVRDQERAVQGARQESGDRQVP